MFTFNEAAVALGSSLISVAMYIGAHRAGIISFFKKEAPAAVGVLETTFHVAEGIAELPLAKTIEADLRHKLNVEQGKSQESEIGRIAGAALNALEADLKGLSNEQKTAILLEIGKLLPAEWNVSKADIEKALTEVQKLSDTIAAARSIVLANQFTQEVNTKASAAPA